MVKLPRGCAKATGTSVKAANKVSKIVAMRRNFFMITSNLSLMGGCAQRFESRKRSFIVQDRKVRIDRQRLFEILARLAVIVEGSGDHARVIIQSGLARSQRQSLIHIQLCLIVIAILIFRPRGSIVSVNILA